MAPSLDIAIKDTFEWVWEVTVERGAYVMVHISIAPRGHIDAVKLSRLIAKYYPYQPYSFCISYEWQPLKLPALFSALL